MTVLTVFEYIAVLSFAVSGSILAVRKHMDLYGSLILALMTAMGGGLMRDVMIGNIPPLVLSDASYLLVAAGASAIVYLLYERIETLQYPLRILDAVGLGIFTVLGTRLALDYGLPVYSSVMIGMISGTGGGMIRDVLAREVPLVLQREIYAMAAFLGGSGYVLIVRMLRPSEQLEPWIALAMAFFIAIFRILSVYKDWHMPRAYHRHGE